MKTRTLVTAVAVAGGMALAAPAAAQESGTFTLTQNGSQIATETFTRSEGMLETELMIPGQAMIATEATLAENAIVDRLEIRVYPPQSPDDAEPMQTTAAAFDRDSVLVEQPIGTQAGGQPAVRGTVPFLNPSPSHLEQMLRRARALGGSNVTVQIWVPGQGAGQVVPANVAFGDHGTATLALGSVSFQVQTDDDGRLLGAEVPSQGLTIERQ